MAPSSRREPSEATGRPADCPSAGFDRRRFLAAAAGTAVGAASSSFAVGGGDEPGAKSAPPKANDPGRLRRGENFSHNELRLREDNYTRSLLAREV